MRGGREHGGRWGGGGERGGGIFVFLMINR